LLASLSCHGCQSQNGYQDKFTHVESPVLDDGKLNEWLDPLCEHSHASAQPANSPADGDVTPQACAPASSALHKTVSAP
jgi:hypothetical protein